MTKCKNCGHEIVKASHVIGGWRHSDLFHVMPIRSNNNYVLDDLINCYCGCTNPQPIGGEKK